MGPLEEDKKCEGNKCCALGEGDAMQEQGLSSAVAMAAALPISLPQALEAVRCFLGVWEGNFECSIYIQHVFNSVCICGLVPRSSLYIKLHAVEVLYSLKQQIG